MAKSSVKLTIKGGVIMSIQQIKMTKLFCKISIVAPMNGLLALTLLLTLSISLSAQTIPFSVNMEHIFLEAGDKVVVRGNIPELGNWEQAGELVLRKQGNQGIYSGSIKLDQPGQEPILYKFIILRRGGTEEWEQRGNRVFDSENTEPVWFDDRSTPGVQQTVVQVTFTLDLTRHSMNGLPTEGVALLGAHAPLSFDLENGRTEMTQINEGIWETTVTFPYGTPHDVPFKFAWKHQGEWMWEYRPGHTNHVFLIDDAGTEQTIQLVYDIQRLSVAAVAGTSGFVDDYDAVLASLPEQMRATSRYHYEKAMEQLRAGNAEAATATYATYKAGHPGGEEIDDFHYRMVYHIKNTQGSESARSYIEHQLSEETIPERRDYFGYMKGELALHEGNYTEARRQFRKVEAEGSWEIATEYASQALVHSYLTESNPDSILKGVTILEGKAARAPQAESRKYLIRLERAYRTADMPEQRKATLTELAMTGSPEQQVHYKIRLADAYLKESQASEALGLLDITEFESTLPNGLQAQLVRLKLSAYHELEMHQELATLYEEYTDQWPDDAYAKRLGKLNEEAHKKLGQGWKNIGNQNPGMHAAPADSTQN